MFHFNCIVICSTILSALVHTLETIWIERLAKVIQTVQLVEDVQLDQVVGIGVQSANGGLQELRGFRLSNSRYAN